MFDKRKDSRAQFQAMQKLMKDESVQAFLSHPKVRELFQDPAFKEVAKSRDFSQIVMHPKFTELARDPEVSQLLFRINPRKLQP